MSQSANTRPLRIVVLNNDSETLKTIAQWFEINGHRVTTSALAAMRRADLDEIADFLTRHNPDVVVYDIAMPYVPNWDYLTVLRTAPDLPRIPYIVTTPNKAALDRLVGANDALELLGQPEDLTAVLRAAESSGFRSSQKGSFRFRVYGAVSARCPSARDQTDVRCERPHNAVGTRRGLARTPQAPPAHRATAGGGSAVALVRGMCAALSCAR